METPVISLAPYHFVSVQEDNTQIRLAFPKFRLLLLGLEKDLQGMKETAEKIHRYGEIIPISYIEEKDLKLKLEDLGDATFHVIALSGTDAASKLVLNWLDDRDASIQQNGGHLFVAKMVDLNKIPELPKNKNLSVVPSLKEEDNAKWATAFASVVCAYGQMEPARPFQTLRVIESQNKDLTFKQKTILLDKRFCAWGIEDGWVKIERIVTTDFDDSNVSYRDLNHKLILSLIRNDLKIFLKSAFPRHMLSEDPRSQGDVVTPNVLKAFIVDRHKLWLRYNLCQDPKDDFSKTLSVSIDQSPGKVNIAMSVYLMGQIIQTHTKLTFRV
jgi:phage tail sheath gpL-like